MIKPNSISKFNFNPFSGIFKEDLDNIIVPQIDLNSIINTIGSEASSHIELLGKQGRGKTTHLQWISNHLPQHPLYLLSAKSNLDDLLKDKSDVLLIDSIHHIPIIKRIKLFKSKKTILFTTHWTRKIECLLANKDLITIKIKGIEADRLKSILNKRLKMAASEELNQDDYFSIAEVNSLIRKYNDNYRGIINMLYENYQR